MAGTPTDEPETEAASPKAEADVADQADEATTADEADEATTADEATKADQADEATTADQADEATTADEATKADQADEAGEATTADQQPAEPETAEAGSSVEPGPAGSADAGDAGAKEAPGAWGALARQRGFVAGAVAVGLVVLVLGGWAVDAVVRSGQVRRNVELAGHTVGGLDRAAVAALAGDLSAQAADRQVTIRSGDQTYESDAATLGLSLDEQATVDAVFDVGRGGLFLLRPLSWAGSWFGTDEVRPHYQVDETQLAAALEAAQGAARTSPVEPSMQLGEVGFALVPGQPGRGLDPAEVSDALLDAATAPGSVDDPIAIEVDPTTLAPRFDDHEVEALVDQANAMTAEGLAVHAGEVVEDVSTEQLREWISMVVAGGDGGSDGGLELAFDRDRATAELPAIVGQVGPAPVNATVTLGGTGTPVVVPATNGVTCCGTDAGDRVWQALRAGEVDVEVEVPVVEPEWTTEEVQGWRITQPIGGARAWRNGGPVAGPAPGFTTYHSCCASRVTNIHRIADLVRGAVVPPGGEFSINDHVGRRTAEGGFVFAGAIRDGEHVDEIGGGVSQFATTTFNAAYFAGLDIPEYQAHSEYFSRYPRGREATMGFPNPDLRIRNNTPYGLLIWTSYTDTSLTVTVYSSPWATAEQTSIGEGSYGACRNVSTTRTRTYPDGTTAQDTFRATYRPGPGQGC